MVAKFGIIVPGGVWATAGNAESSPNKSKKARTGRTRDDDFFVRYRPGGGLLPGPEPRSERKPGPPTGPPEFPVVRPRPRNGYAPMRIKRRIPGLLYRDPEAHRGVIARVQRDAVDSHYVSREFALIAIGLFSQIRRRPTIDNQPDIISSAVLI